MGQFNPSISLLIESTIAILQPNSDPMNILLIFSRFGLGFAKAKKCQGLMWISYPTFQDLNRERKRERGRLNLQSLISNALGIGRSYRNSADENALCWRYSNQSALIQAKC